jgi:hypothetical protein
MELQKVKRFILGRITTVVANILIFRGEEEIRLNGKPVGLQRPLSRCFAERQLPGETADTSCILRITDNLAEISADYSKL